MNSETKTYLKFKIYQITYQVLMRTINKPTFATFYASISNKALNNPKKKKLNQNFAIFPES